MASQPTSLLHQLCLHCVTGNLPSSNILKRALDSFGMTFKCTLSPPYDTALSLDPDEKPPGSDIVAVMISLALQFNSRHSLVDLLDQVRVLAALCSEARMRLSWVVSLYTLSVFGSKLVGWKVGSFLLGNLRGNGGLAKGSGGVGVRFRHDVDGAITDLVVLCLYGLNNEVFRELRLYQRRRFNVIC